MDVLRHKPQVFFHVFKWKDQFLLFDRSSHSLFQTEEEVWVDFQKNEWSPNLTELLKEGQSQDYFSHRKAPLPFDDQRCIKSLCLMVTRACNFRCKYCFEASQPLESHHTGSMSLETAKKAIDWLILQGKERKQLEIDFFGGEPLLYFPLVREAVLYARSREKDSGKRFLMSITTNASLLSNEIADFFQEKHLSVIFSLDGSREVNDLFRVDAQCKGTYDQSIKNILNSIPKLATGYYVRGTYTHQSLHFCKEIQDLYHTGIKQISFEPVATLLPELAIQESDLPIIKQEYEKLADWLLLQTKIDPRLHFYHFELDLEKSICFEKLTTGCGAGVEYLSLSPEGKLYPCHQFDGRKEFCLGDLDSKDPDSELTALFKRKTLSDSREECVECWAKTLCGGGCLANNLIMNQGMDKAYEIGCKIQKLRLEAALYYQGMKKLS
jgi:uncharacterized protein